eukprot:2764683-Rhodomonas_salina.1
MRERCRCISPGSSDCRCFSCKPPYNPSVPAGTTGLYQTVTDGTKRQYQLVQRACTLVQSVSARTATAGASAVNPRTTRQYQLVPRAYIPRTGCTENAPPSSLKLSCEIKCIPRADWGYLSLLLLEFDHELVDVHVTPLLVLLDT